MPLDKTRQDLIRNYQDKLRILQSKYQEDMKGLQQKIRDLQSGKALEEDGDAAITTSSMGGTAFNSDGEVTTPAYGNNAAVVPYYGSMVSRYGQYSKKKKKKKYHRESMNQVNDFIDKL